MRCLLGFVCVCALGFVPLLGCADVDVVENGGGSGGSAGTGGSGGVGGTGGSGGSAGTGGSGGVGGTGGSGGSPAVVTVTLTVTLDEGTIPDGVVCNDTWMEAGVTLSLVQTTSDDCTLDRCSFGIRPGTVDLYPARLNLDVSGLSGKVTSAEADVTDGCRANCTGLFLYDGANLVATTRNTSTGQETLSAIVGDVNIDRIAVSSCEGGVNEVRIQLEVAL